MFPPKGICKSRKKSGIWIQENEQKTEENPEAKTV